MIITSSEKQEFQEWLQATIQDAVTTVVTQSFATTYNKKLLTEAEAASQLRVKPQTLSLWRHEGRGPEYRKHGSRVVYSESAIEAYSDSNLVKPS